MSKKKEQCMEIKNLRKALKRLDKAIFGDEPEDVNDGLRAVRMAYKQYEQAVKIDEFTPI